MYRCLVVRFSVLIRRSYPGALKGHLHRTKAYLPVNIAKALSKSPELVQRAVEGFYVRDPAQLRVSFRFSSASYHYNTPHRANLN